MAKPNYAFAKRQRDIAKKQKQEEKQRLKAAAQQPPAEADGQIQPSTDEKSADKAPVST